MENIEEKKEDIFNPQENLSLKKPKIKLIVSSLIVFIIILVSCLYFLNSKGVVKISFLDFQNKGEQINRVEKENSIYPDASDEDLQKIENILDEYIKNQKEYITFTSKNYNFSFTHSNKYINETEEAILEKEAVCPSGGQESCDSKMNDELNNTATKICKDWVENKDKYKEKGFLVGPGYSSIEECKAKYLETFSGLIQEQKNLTEGIINSPKDQEGDYSFRLRREYEIEHNLAYEHGETPYLQPIHYGFFYSVPGVETEKNVLYVNDYADESVTYTIPNSSQTSYYIPKMVVVLEPTGKVIIKIVDPRPNINKSPGESSWIPYSKLPLIKETEIESYYTNKNGAKFYQINEGTLEDYRNIYCAIKITAVCFHIKANVGALEFNSESYKKFFSLEKEIMKPIEETFKFLD